jgi:aspartyl-tRNA(Asn)/glutamyl-tRNA(Gln) amidotransferase subunit C
MQITDDDVQYLAVLSNITLGADEAAGLRQNLADIIEYIHQLAELDTTGVEPTFQLTGLSNVWRDDEITPQLLREKLLKLAPEQKDNQMKVPKVL